MAHTTLRDTRETATGQRPAVVNLAASVAVIALGIMGYWALGRSAVLINTAVLLAGLTWCARIVHYDIRKTPRHHSNA